MDFLPGFLKGAPETEEVRQAKSAVETASNAVDAAVGNKAKALAKVEVAKAERDLAVAKAKAAGDRAVADAEEAASKVPEHTPVSGTAAVPGSLGGKRRKGTRRGGKSKRGRTGRKSSRL